MSWTGCQCSLRREGGSPCLPSAPGGCRWSSRRKAHGHCLKRARTQGQLPWELCRQKAHPKSCLSNSFTTQSLTRTPGNWDGGEVTQAEGKKLTVGEKLEMRRGRVRIQPMVGGAMDEEHLLAGEIRTLDPQPSRESHPCSAKLGTDPWTKFSTS